MIAIVDYEMGNLRSVAKAFEALGAPCEVTRDPTVIARADKVVVPGVGAFRDCMGNLEKFGLIPALQDSIASGKPYLGICLGMQILMTESEEGLGQKGLGIIPGSVVKFSSDLNLKIPHIGWNQLHKKQDSRLFHGIPEASSVYFVHSYYVKPDDASVTATTTDYGADFCSSLERGNVHAVQFHPEKSQKIGLQILENFWKRI